MRESICFMMALASVVIFGTAGAMLVINFGFLWGGVPALMCGVAGGLLEVFFIDLMEP